MSEPIDYDDLSKRLSELAYDKESRLTGTPMIPLHEGTVIAVLDAINALRTDRDCRAGWLAQFVIDKFNGTPDLDGWVRRSATYYSELLQRAERAEADNAALRKDAERYRAALRSIFFLEHHEREWNSLEEAQEFARIECESIDAAMLAGKEKS